MSSYNNKIVFMTSYSLTDVNKVPLDLKLDELFKKKENGFFIELGAHDGISQSNTAFFEFTRNWKGILIEPSYDNYLKCIKNRPKSKCFNFACVSCDYKLDYIKGDFHNHLMSSVDGKRLRQRNLVDVKVSTLEKIIESVNPDKIDLLSLDTEGYELEILKGLNLKRYRPTYLLIEVYNYDYDNIVEFLRLNEYVLHSNFSIYNKIQHPQWDGTHNDYLFVNTKINLNRI